MNRRICLCSVLVAISIIFFGCGGGGGSGDSSEPLAGQGSASVQTVTPEEVEASIQAGLDWLVSQQNADGSWGTSDRVATTGFAVVKLEDRAFELGYPSPFDDAYPYKESIIDGLDYIFSQARLVGISVQPAGNPDANGDGVGVSIYDIGVYENYATGIAMMAIAASKDPERFVTSGPLSGQKYKNVLQNAADFLAYGQTDSGFGRGGWNYTANSGTRSDNSISGYAVLGLRYAESSAFGFQCIIPAFVKSELSFWIDWIQCRTGPNYGGSGYASPCDWVNLLKTGNLLFQMSFVGDDQTSGRVQDAIGYIEATWDELAGSSTPGWRTPPHLQAMYKLMKGFQSLDIDTIVVGSGAIDWFADPNQFADVLVISQNGDGSWPQDPWDSGSPPILSTCWALLTLEKVAPPPPVNIEVSLPDCACDTDVYPVDIEYTVERFIVDGDLTVYEDGNLVETVQLTSFTGTYTYTVEADPDEAGSHTWEVFLNVAPVGGGTATQADDSASIEICETPEVLDIPDQNLPFEGFDLNDYLEYDGGLPVTWSRSTPPAGWTVEIMVDSSVTVTAPEGATEPATITFTASIECCSEVICSDSDEVTFTPNRQPDCTATYADPDCIWPPNHQMVPVGIYGASDPDGDPVTITIIRITSDEPTATQLGAGGPIHAPDGLVVGEGIAEIRAERSGNGDGRVYEIDFLASDGRGGECGGSVLVKVPHDRSAKDCPAVDSGQDYDATDIN